MKYMLNCYHCNKKAKMWTGHIHTIKGIIITGFCREHYKLLSDKNYDKTYHKDIISNCENYSGCYGYRTEKIASFKLEN